MPKRRGNRNDMDRRAKQARTEGEGKDGWTGTHVDKNSFTNAKFEAYYRGHIVKEEDWEAFINAMRSHLPISFRLSTIGGRQGYILDALKGACFGLPKTPQSFQIDDEAEPTIVEAPKPLPWYSPFGHAWQIAVGKRALKKIPALRQFRQFLMREDKQGNITRQEAVSMIPPQLLGVQPHHIVLDMCAAPGSKTAQLLEDLHKGGSAQVPTGVVVANDSDPDRAYMLVHQLKRLGSPAFLVTTHAGQFFPNLYLPRHSTHAATELAYREDAPNSKISKMEAAFTSAATPQMDMTSYSVPNSGTNSTAADAPLPLLFDRILCDVPCSGDGTMRKCPNIWRNWSVGTGHGLHPLQLSIAWRAAQMLRVGGRMVYSTCSLNPMENEAVVAELIRRSRGSLRIVDVSDQLNGLIREPGMLDWKVLLESTDFSKDPEGLAAHEAKLRERGELAEGDFVPKAAMHNVDSLDALQDLGFMKRKKVRPSFFSPSKLASFAKRTQALWDENAAADNGKNMERDTLGPKAQIYNHLPTAEEMGLDRCVRILPQRQDTGGFFIVLIEKVDVLPQWDGENNEKKPVEEKTATPAAEPVTEEKAALSMKSVDPTATKKLNFNKKPQQKQWNDFPFTNLNPDLCALLERTFKLDASKGYSPKNLFCRSDNLAGSGKKVYYLSDTIGDVVNTPQNYRLKVVHSGLKIFEASSSAYEKAMKAAAKSEHPTKLEDLAFRLTQDALAFVLPFVGKQVLRIGHQDMVTLLKGKDGVHFKDLSDPLCAIMRNIPDFTKGDVDEDPDATIVEGVVNSSKIYLGSCVLRVLGEDVPAGAMTNQVLSAAWRTGCTLNLMIDSAERDSLLNLFVPPTDEEDKE